MPTLCPNCRAPEVEASTPRTTYACGSSDYDQRPGTFERRCALTSEQVEAAAQAAHEDRKG